MSRLKILQELAELLGKHQWMLATAESCTGGGVAKAITELPGSSAWFNCGLVTYSNSAKTALLGVQPTSLQAFGAVSETVVKEMVAGACIHGQAHFALATSGVAGPEGGTADKPVGTVWLAWGSAQEQQTLVCHFPGDRRSIREASIDRVLEELLYYLQQQ
ncbi:nicotinamide-nucleotide amidase [Marinospirillum celere]|uniref:Nicotinamide-nucleotide amidase n=1 Tax=Marinospirillum celere TaxID=1122252 RepID=A0A1I1FKD9_9GAMM|nr:CinA family protein [Marinospirillum celere]SFB99452.1 nicotinamide-nucleotide amidase [Marinospirillum celere]